jgi:transcriptional regulator with XRE-family HTH domain
MGLLIKAFRRHPAHGRQPISQETAAGWAGLSQAQLSRIESRGVSDLERLAEWARILGIPPRYLWFRLPDDRAKEPDTVNRGQFLKLGAMVVASAAVTPLLGEPQRMLTDDDCAQWLAWEMWKRRVRSLHHSELPTPIARHLAAWTTGPAAGIILRDRDGSYSFAHTTFVDFYVAQRIFGDIATGDSALFATAQTSHETDLIIREFVARDDTSAASLTGWMKRAPNAVLRVNAAGVLAKVGSASLTDNVVQTLKSHAGTRQLYLTAVASRVLELPWEHAAKMATVVERGPAQLPELLSLDQAGYATSKLAAELHNPRDGAARWCAVVLMDQLRAASPDVASAALHAALRAEKGTENLRSIGAALAGDNPITV